MAFAVSAEYDILRSLGFGSISTTYAKLGVSFSHICRVLKIINNTDGDMFIAMTNGSGPASDGSADNDFIPAGGFVLYDVTSDGSDSQPKPFAFGSGKQLWVRYSSAPTKNSVYAAVLYGLGE